MRNVILFKFYHILKDFDAFQIETNREKDLRSREIKSIKKNGLKDMT